MDVSERLESQDDPQKSFVSQRQSELTATDRRPTRRNNPNDDFYYDDSPAIPLEDAIQKQYIPPVTVMNQYMKEDQEEVCGGLFDAYKPKLLSDSTLNNVLE